MPKKGENGLIDQAGIMMAQGRSIASGRIQGVNDNMSKPHYHDYFELYYLEEGERLHIIQDRLYCIHPREFLIFSPYAMCHSYGRENVPFERFLVHFFKEEVGFVQLLKTLEKGTGVYKPNQWEKQMVHRMLDDLLKEQDDPQTYHEDYIHTLLNTALPIIARNIQTPMKPEEHSRIADVISYIHQNYQEDISIDQLAQMSYVGPYYLYREFKWYTNSTIIQYMNVTRIMNARRMFMEANKSITEIGRGIGFSNITHFNRVFKSIVGMAPSNFRKIYKTEAGHGRRTI